ncbi:MAG: Hsp20/alpha crystallin family protein [Spirochaetales bacterium]|nr:Hsp20/alpha crystallin family protein [Spirochaetales bacterium]
MEKKEVTKSRRICPARCDISEENGNIILRMEMPGVMKDNLDVKIDGDILVVEGKKEIPRIKEGEFLVQEIRHADYHQEFTLDDTIDRNRIEAELKKGILHLTLHIKESEKPRKINVVTK